MIALTAAEALLDFGVRLGAGAEARAREQLEGAVALHNILERHGVAYLADEVGMGKTYVALGAVALFRHYDPSFRVLIIAPRENIQRKWRKEFRNFVEHNVRHPDLRVKALDGRPARALVGCENLIQLLAEASLDPDRDFFARLTSFSLGLAGKEEVEPKAGRALRDSMRRHLPWLPDGIFDLRSKSAFKDNVARAICCGLPTFDLVIVDEGHNLKHGFGARIAARNRVLALAFGHPSQKPSREQFPGYGPRARRVLFLSATPIEETYQHLWNQLDVFGKGAAFEDLRRADVTDEAKKGLAAQFLVRRVTAMRVGGERWTKNLYRREWRAGGVSRHDDPIEVTDDRQRLVVALVQKKVNEILGNERFNGSFQIGMLASFESFLQTAGLRPDDVAEERGNFDDAEQTDDQVERDGVDVVEINRLAAHYRKRFGRELPHPKMDAVVASLAGTWKTGNKALVFVRRVASVKELKRKLDELYDLWLLGSLRARLPESVLPRLDALEQQYRAEKQVALEKDADKESMTGGPGVAGADDRGGAETFFAWFFRGEGPRGVVSGANVQRRFISSRGALGTFFEDNRVADLLGCRPGHVFESLQTVLGRSAEDLKSELRRRGQRYLSRARRQERADRFEAAQAAAIELMAETPGPHQEAARVVYHLRFQDSLRQPPALEAPELADALETRSFFSELRMRPELRERLWPEPSVADAGTRVRVRELRAQLLASAARLGHAFVDLYVLVIRRLGSLEAGAQELGDGDDEAADEARIAEYLDHLEGQMRTPLAERGWGAFDELAEMATHFDLILDVNEPAAWNQRLCETARAFGNLLRQQQPIGGMYGKVNATLVRQFRMPGYPLVLVSTDLLQEGEDLHTFCSNIQHYGIAWTPSSMEQRIGRIDRVRSATDRRLSRLDRAPAGEDLLQVHYPYLDDTIEVLQVAKVLERVNQFLRLMHEGLHTAGNEERQINVEREIHRGVRMPSPITTPLQTAFPVPSWALAGKVRVPAVAPELAVRAAERLRRLAERGLPGVEVEWEPVVTPGELLGTVRLKHRRQGFRLVLSSLGARFSLRCQSPIGRRDLGDDLSDLAASVARSPARVVLAVVGVPPEWSLAVEDEVLLAEPAHDAARAAGLVARVVGSADALEHSHWDGVDHAPEGLRGHFEVESDGD